MQEDDQTPRIQRLEADVVNRIAAGEVVQRPANAVKELIENSLDAGSRSIVLTIKDGGLKLLQIQDDGHGIRVEDMGLVCERFTTSKLQKFEDLRTISSFGFRGEALASITHVAHVTITSKTRNSPCAYRARYSDGRLVPLKPTDKEARPQPCAGTNGTTITVEDLFYNMQTRRAAFKNLNEQYRGILDVVTRYAVHYGHKGISFTCKKHGVSGADLHTPKGGTVLGNIKQAFGQAVARELLELKCTDPSPSTAAASTQASSAAADSDAADSATAADDSVSAQEEGEGGGFRFRATGYISNANYNMKKGVFMLFINHRLVESAAIRKTVEAVYAPILPNNTHPFVYLSIEMPPEQLDVNVHPTKREVHFLYEDVVLEKLAAAVTARLSGANTSRTFYGKSLAPGLPPLSTYAQVVGGAQSTQGSGKVDSIPSSRAAEASADGDEPAAAPAAPAAARAPAKLPYKLVRTDASMGSLRSFLYTEDGAKSQGRTQDSQLAAAADLSQPSKKSRVNGEDSTQDDLAAMELVDDDGGGNQAEQLSQSQSQQEITPSRDGRYRRKLPSFSETKCQYHSIQALIADIRDRSHQGLLSILKRHTFVGVVDKDISLIQHNIKLLMVRHVDLGKELFYQLAVRRFGSMPRLLLDENPVSLREALLVALDLPEVQWTEEHGPKDKLADLAVSVLKSKAAMLDDYFRIGIQGESPELVSLPDLLSGYYPTPEAVPLFLLRLATEVNWEEEQACFEGIATELAIFYSDFSSYTEDWGDQQPDEADTGPVPVKYERLLQDVLYPAFRSIFLPSRDFASDRTVTELASLNQLYRVFERC